MTQQIQDYEENIRFFTSLPFKKGEYKSRAWGHSLHFLLSYPSKLKPAIAFYLVKLFSKPKDIILDPFSGSGTIPFEACSQGRIGIGCDITPLAYHTTKAKVSGVSINELEKQITKLDKFIQQNKMKLSECEDEIVDYFHKKTLNEILSAREFFLQHEKEDYSFLIACLAHILHGNRPYALSRRSHNIMPWPPKGPTIYKNVIEHLREKVYRMKKSELPSTFVKGSSYQCDTTNLPFKDNSIDCIITSPPFLYNRDFLRMNRIRLWFCGWDYSTQKQYKEKFIENVPYIESYTKIFDEYFRLLKPHSHCILHLGIVKDIDMAHKLSPIAEKSGFRVNSIINEDSTSLESHGIRDRGATRTHQFLFLQK